MSNTNGSLNGQVRVLEILDGFGSRQDGLGLLECVHHLLPGCLADLEILLVIEELLSLGLLLNLVDLGLGLLLVGGVGVCHQFPQQCCKRCLCSWA